jgi:hypothetical protein
MYKDYEDPNFSGKQQVPQRENHKTELVDYYRKARVSRPYSASSASGLLP